jgi:RNA polymerase sigma-70 factor (ECF subfamily)
MELAIAFHEAWNTARQAWPGVVVERNVFVERLRACGMDGQAVVDRGNDIYLSVACAAGDAAAVRLFEQMFLRVAPRQLGRVVLTLDQQDELLQRLRVKLLVGPSARIRDYKGSGPLGAWVRVCAVRVALEMATARQDSQTDDRKTVDALVANTPDPEFVMASHQHAETFRRALQDALTTLSARDKTILRLHYLDEMNIDALGNVYGVHRATVARWLVAIRTGVLKEVRVRFSMQIGASPSEARSLARFLACDGGVSVASHVDRGLATEPQGLARFLG